MSRAGVVLAAVVLAAGGLVACGGGSSDDGDAAFPDPAADCREAGGDLTTTRPRDGESEAVEIVCAPGVDISEVRVAIDGESMRVTVDLADEPMLESSVAWQLQLFLDGDEPRICGIGNVDADGATGDEPVAYAIDPATRERSTGTTCEGSLDGSTVELVFDVADGRRLLGGTHLELADAGAAPDYDESADDVVIVLPQS